MPCVWVEDLYFRKEYRGRGYADRFFAYLKKQWQDRPVRFRLEVEQENAHACHVYRKNGWKAIGYLPLEDLSEAGKLLMETYMNNPMQN